MAKNSSRPFYIDSTARQLSSQPSAYIFDETYKTKLQKNKCFNNPKFAYFNALMKIKNKLGTQQHQIYQLIFEKQSNQNQNKIRLINNEQKVKFNQTGSWLRKRPMASNINNIEQQKNGQNGGMSYRNSVNEIQFQGVSRKHKRRQSQYYCNQRPRLDDILAQYKRLSRKQKQTKNNFSFRQTSKTFQQFSLINRAGKLLSRNFSQNTRGRKYKQNINY